MGRFDNPMPESTLSPQPGPMNWASGHEASTLDNGDKVAQCEKTILFWVIAIILFLNYFIMIHDYLCCADGIGRKPLISTVLWHLTNLLFFADWCKAPKVNNKYKTCKENFFLLASKAIEEKIRIRNPVVRIRVSGSGSVSKCHGSGPEPCLWHTPYFDGNEPADKSASSHFA